MMSFPPCPSAENHLGISVLMTLRPALQSNPGMATLEKFQLESFFQFWESPFVYSAERMPKTDVKTIVFSSRVK